MTLRRHAQNNRADPMLLTWLRNRRRRQLLATPFPNAWPALLDQIAYYRQLPAAAQARLRDLTRVFVAEREFEGCKGLEITDEVRVTIAALACVLLLGLEGFYFDNVPTILVYPEPYVAPEQEVIGGVVLESASDRLGEAHQHGPVIVSWPEVLHCARNRGEGTNLIWHEFAHQLDMRNGAADGVPLLPRALQKRWQEVMAREYKRLCRAAGHGRTTLIDPYGAANPAEFFAVVTECFFDVPQELKARHPDLYDLLRLYYGQNPAED